MAYQPKPCRGCGGPKDISVQGVRYCSLCRQHTGKTPIGACTMSAEHRARQVRMVDLYKSGQTQDQIGRMYGITRERVRQIIKKVGVVGKDGGATVKSQRNKEWKDKRRAFRLDQSYMRIYGCTYAEFEAMGWEPKEKRKGGLAWAYRYQKHNASLRSIPWRFSIVSWYAVWVESGKLSERGRSGDSYVMARYSDTGPYSPANVYITTLRDNSRDYQAHRLGRTPSYAQLDERRK
jgi:DNA-binding CsgD family transcriptional regulator